MFEIISRYFSIKLLELKNLLNYVKYDVLGCKRNCNIFIDGLRSKLFKEKGLMLEVYVVSNTIPLTALIYSDFITEKSKSPYGTIEKCPGNYELYFDIKPEKIKINAKYYKSKYIKI